jgi:AcrR family transcriptional regulator
MAAIEPGQQEMATLSRAGRRKAQARLDLTAAARALIAEKGVAGLRVSDVTDRADIALGSFYSHFDTKEDIVEAVVAETIGGLAEAIVTMTSSLDDPAEEMSVAVRRFVGLAYDNPELAWLLVNLNSAEARFEGMVLPHAQAVLERGIAAKRFELEDAAVTLSITVGAALAVIRGVLDHRLPAGADVMCAESILCMVGIESAEALEIANRELPEISLPA